MNRIAGKYAPIRKLNDLQEESYLSYLLGSKGFRREVVLRILRPMHVPDFQSKLQDAKLCARLSHTNIVQVLDLGQHQGLWFIASEYIDGLSLEEMLDICLKCKIQIPLPIINYILAETLKGFSYAHRVKIVTSKGKQGFLHRNICAQNIMIDFHGGVKIANFSRRSKLASDSPFRPPEGFVDPRSDIFSYGVLLERILQFADCNPKHKQNLLRISQQAQNPSAQKRFHSMEAIREAIFNDFSIIPTASGDLSILISQLQYTEESLHTEEQPTMISMTIPLSIEEFDEESEVETRVTREEWEDEEEINESTIVILPDENFVLSWQIITAVSVFFLTIMGLFIGYFLGQRTMKPPQHSLKIFHPPAYKIKLNGEPLEKATKNQGLKPQAKHKLEVWDTTKHHHKFDFQLKSGENRIFLFPVYEEVKPSKTR